MQISIERGKDKRLKRTKRVKGEIISLYQRTVILFSIKSAKKCDGIIYLNLSLKIVAKETEFSKKYQKVKGFLREFNFFCRWDNLTPLF